MVSDKLSSNYVLNKNINAVRNALREVFSKRFYFFLFFFISLSLLFLYIWIPIRITPGNDFSFALSLLKWYDITLFILLAFGVGLTLTFQTYIWRQRRASLSNASAGMFAGFSTIFASLFSSATCVSCLTSLLTLFVPTSGLLFMIKYSLFIILGSLVLVLISLNFAIKTINDGCTDCKIPIRKA
jgi:hypothetical protein